MKSPNTQSNPHNPEEAPKLRLPYRGLLALANLRDRISTTPERQMTRTEEVARKIGAAALTPAGLIGAGVLGLTAARMGGHLSPDMLHHFNFGSGNHHTLAEAHQNIATDAVHHPTEHPQKIELGKIQQNEGIFDYVHDQAEANGASEHEATQIANEAAFHDKQLLHDLLEANDHNYSAYNTESHNPDHQVLGWGHAGKLNQHEHEVLSDFLQKELDDHKHHDSHPVTHGSAAVHHEAKHEEAPKPLHAHSEATAESHDFESSDLARGLELGSIIAGAGGAGYVGQDIAREKITEYRENKKKKAEETRPTETSKPPETANKLENDIREISRDQNWDTLKEYLSGLVSPEKSKEKQLHHQLAMAIPNIAYVAAREATPRLVAAESDKKASVFDAFSKDLYHTFDFLKDGPAKQQLLASCYRALIGKIHNGGQGLYDFDEQGVLQVKKGSENTWLQLLERGPGTLHEAYKQDHKLWDPSSAHANASAEELSRELTDDIYLAHVMAFQETHEPTSYIKVTGDRPKLTDYFLFDPKDNRNLQFGRSSIPARTSLFLKSCGVIAWEGSADSSSGPNYTGEVWVKSGERNGKYVVQLGGDFGKDRVGRYVDCLITLAFGSEDAQQKFVRSLSAGPEIIDSFIGKKLNLARDTEGSLFSSIKGIYSGNEAATA